VTLTSGYLSPRDYMHLAARHSAVVSMRMHGAILAAVSGTPALLANAAAKTRWADDLGFEALRDPDELGGLDDRLAGLVSELRRWRRDQRRAVAQLRRLAERNARLVAEVL
jgi:polysaccharide pyruvyl transferase WcaK-like protein